MKQTIAPKSSTPSPQSRDKSPTAVGPANKPVAVFVSMALDMTWRLALVVLVPIVGGFELDRHWHTAPLLTIIGFVLAMGGVALVMRQTLQAATKGQAL
jgi:F0F1-type ATP synthase assembly protein I